MKLFVCTIAVEQENAQNEREAAPVLHSKLCRIQYNQNQIFYSVFNQFYIFY